MESFLNQYRIKDQTIAVGVSGGADSLALVLKANEELTVFGRKIIALTVNHKLRPSSDDEAQYVNTLMKQNHIEHHILTWDDPKPENGTEEAAREARYSLMINWCKQHHIQALMVAHHRQDQAETFLMRLERGSGLEGLCSMRPVCLRDGVRILRPFLNTNPQDLKTYLRRKNIRWVDDESNNETKFLRNRLRRFFPILSKETGISASKIVTAVNNLQCAEDFIQSAVETVLNQQVKSPQSDVFHFKYSDFLTWHKEIKFRIISHLCRRAYIPRADRVLHLIKLLEKLPFKCATLGKKEIVLFNNEVWILPENQLKIANAAQKWKAYSEKNPQYQNKKLPHQFRWLLLKEEENKK